MDFIDFKKCSQSKGFQITIIVIGVIIVALTIFQAGMFVGFKKASFSYGFGENYYQNFGGRMMDKNFDGMMGGFPQGGELENSHGTIGKIVKISLPTIVVDDRDGIEKIVVTSKDTVVREFRDNIELKNLKVGDSIVVIGTPNDKSQIEAKIIRLMPSPPDMIKTATTTKTK